MTTWQLSHRADPPARRIADRHYNRQHVGATQFVPPGRPIVLLSATRDALWISSWPIAEYVKHAWAGAWMNTLFRNEGLELSSTLIREAVAITRHLWGDSPPLGMVTFVDAAKVRHKRDPGRCYLKAGFRYARDSEGRQRFTKGGLVVLELPPGDMPEPLAPSTPLFAGLGA